MHICFNGLCYRRKIGLVVVGTAVVSSVVIALVSMPTALTVSANDTKDPRRQSSAKQESALRERAMPKQKTSTQRGKPVAVVELFTSEGCSSCPPADKNLLRLAKLGSTTHPNLIPLSFHVDYWNKLGWVDPLSQAKFTTRQRGYAVVMNAESVYTPQMIVNGTAEFVGSDRKASDKAIELALKTPVKHLLDLTLIPSETPERVNVRYHVESVIPSPTKQTHVLNMAVVSESESVDVPRGENGGKHLTHAWVVKSFEFVAITEEDGVVSIDARNTKLGHTRIVGYVQSQESKEITGASAIDL